MTKQPEGEIIAATFVCLLGTAAAISLLKMTAEQSASLRLSEIVLIFLIVPFSACCILGGLATLQGNRRLAQKLLRAAAILVLLFNVAGLGFLLLGLDREGPMTRPFAALSTVLALGWAWGLDTLGRWIGRQQDLEN